MEIRRAENRDIPRIHELLTQVNNVHADGRPDLFKKGNRKYTDEQLKTIISDQEKSPIFVLVDDNDMVLGYCFGIVEQFINDNNRTDVKTLYIDDLCVDEAARGKGIGRTLMEYARDYAAVKGCHNLTLHVWEGNPGAQAFYESMGMKTQYTCLEWVL